MDSENDKPINMLSLTVSSQILEVFYASIEMQFAIRPDTFVYMYVK